MTSYILSLSLALLAQAGGYEATGYNYNTIIIISERFVTKFKRIVRGYSSGGKRHRTMTATACALRLPRFNQFWA